MADDGFGASISGASGFFAEIIDIEFSGLSRESIETTHMGTTGGARTFMPADLYDPGELNVTIAWAPNTTPPIASASETYTVTAPIPAGGSSGATWQASAFMTNIGPSIQIGQRMTAACTLKWAGAFTITPGT